MKKMILCTVISLFALLAGTLNAQGESVNTIQYPNTITIFGKNAPRKPVNFGCKPCSAQHGARYQKKTNSIIWKWKNKFSCWCGWAIEGLGISNFEGDIQKHYSLKVAYSGTYTGNQSPQVKFMDGDGNATGLSDFSNYAAKTDASGVTIVVIPIAEFAMEFSIDPSNVQKLQFDAGWNSSTGDIEIQSIQLVRTDSVLKQ